MRPPPDPVFDALRPIGLGEVERTAALLDRVDRKYMVGREDLARAVERLTDTHGVLEIDGVRQFGYRTTYFDTQRLTTYRDHVQQRRRRFKTRAREYVDSGACAFEVKVKGARGRTVKYRMGCDAGIAEALTEPALTFLLDCLRDNYGDRLENGLGPVLSMNYRRLTLVAPGLGERLTCDFDLTFTGPGGASGRMADDVAIVESKSARGTARADHVLRDLGIRPERSCSKYCLGIGLTRPEVKSNAFRHLLRRYFRPLPAGAAAVAATFGFALPAASAPDRAVAAERVATRLPLVTISSPRAIRDEPKVTARMRVIDRRGRRLNRPSHRANVYNGLIGVEHRGQLSITWPKKSMSIETRTRKGKDRDIRLLGLPRDADWVLHASHADRSFVRNALAFRLARRLGAWAPRTRFVEVLINGRYRGVFVLMEQLELNERRIDEPKKTMLLELTVPHKLDESDVSVTGPRTGMSVIIADAGDKISGKEREAARVAIDRLETALYGPAAQDPASGWRRWLDERSAVDFILLQELMRNQDAFWASTHMRLREDGRLRLGPLWDFDLSSGNTFEATQMPPEGWRTPDRAWASELWKDPLFVAALAVRWRELRAKGLIEFTQATARRQSAGLTGPAARNFATWPVLARPVLSHHPVRASYAEEVAGLQDWLGRRAAWIDLALSGH